MNVCRVVIAVVAAALGLSARAGTASGELLHRWSFSGNYDDSVGGVIASQGGSVSWADDNTAVKLPGGDKGAGWVQLGTNILPGDGSPVTLEMWATQDGVQNWARVFDYGYDTANYVIVAWNVGTTDNDRIEVERSGASLYLRDDTAFSVGVKYHLSMTFLPHGDGSTTIRFMRRNATTGALECDCVRTVNDWTLADLTNGRDTPFYLGHSQYDHDNDAAATYDEVRVWRGVLSDTQLTSNAVAGPDTLPPSADCTPRPNLRILPLGDSITWGYVDDVGGGSVPGGYRLPLSQKLASLGYNVEFVGSDVGNGSPDLPYWNHEGHGGWRISHSSVGISEHILGWMDQYEAPDAVLILLGTNDTGNDDFKNAISRIGTLVDQIAGKAPTAHIFVSTLLQRTRGSNNNKQILELFNPKVAGLVEEHVAKGQRVHAVDLCTACPPGDTLSADGLHPHAAGYALVAEGWKNALTNVFPTAAGDTEPPKIARVDCSEDGLRLRVGYSKPVVDATIAAASSYALAGVEDVTVASAEVEGDGRAVNLTLSASLPCGAVVTLSVSGVTDRSTPGRTGASSLTFYRAPGADYRENVPRSEWGAYAHVYTFDIPERGVVDRAVFKSLCSVNREAEAPASFDRIAYCLELQRPDGPLQYAWVSMDAFTDVLENIAVPVGGKIQQKVSNMNVYCNVSGVVTGLGIATGSIEFWPYAYGTAVTAGLNLGGNGSIYDYDDRCDGGEWGSMQVHNWGAKQTIFSYSSWNKSDRVSDVGIGNCPSGNNTDWTMAANASAYSTKRLHIFVRSSDTTPPTLVSATAQESGKRVVVTFSESLSAASLARAVFTSPDFVVKNVTLESDGKTVILDTTTYSPGLGLGALSVSGVRDVSGNAMAEGASVVIAPPSLPSQVRADVGAELDGYELVYEINLPEKGNFNTSRDAYLVDLSDRTNAFDRVAYYMELKKPGADRQWVWTSCDAFAQQRKMLDVPVAASGILYQREVYNAVVKSNIGQSGVYPRGCNLEFWSCNYAGGPAGLTPTAPPKGVYAWDDTFNVDAPLTQGHGSMAFNCYTNSTPLWGIHGFGKDGSVLGLGLGSALGQISGHTSDYDWTFGANADQFETRRLYVFVRPKPRAEDEVRARIGDAAFGTFKTLFAIDQLPVSCRVNDAAWRTNGLYAIDQREAFSTNQIARVGYYMELQKPGEEPVWIWTAMDNFVTDLRHLGIPEGGYAYKKSVTNLTVKSNSSAVTEVDDCATGCVEFWAASYQPGSDGKYDWDDKYDGDGTASNGYGSMQVHNAGAQEVLWALSCFNGGGKPCLGIGKNPNDSEHPDWTLKNNADGYAVRKFYCFVSVGETSSRAEVERTALEQAAAKVGAETLADYKVLFAAESIPTACTGNKWEWMNKNFYTIDNRSAFAPKGFNRVAYFMELQKPDEAQSTWVWTAMDPLCDIGLRHGVPSGGYYFKQDVANLDVRSNCSSITEVTGHSGGCVEFWACGYGVGANGKYDWDDEGFATTLGYGSMQVHNKSAQQVLWAFNNYQNAAIPSIGIGNAPTGEHPDWTFIANADQYAVRRLYCFVRPCTPPGTVTPATGNSIVRATGATSGDRITVRLENTISASELAGAQFSLDHGVTVKRADLIDSTHVVLYTSAFAAGTDLQLSIAGLVDSNGNELTDVEGTVSVPTAAEATLPADIVEAVPALAGYRLVQRLDFDSLSSRDVYRNTPYYVDETACGGVFDRIAYVLDETPQDGAREWVYVSMDAFARDVTKIGLPTYEQGAWYQQKVANLDVAASPNVNVTAGTGLATGNIEFWPQSYGGNASLADIGGGSSYDWNDTASPFGMGYGSMQVHNWSAGQTLLAINRFGENNTDAIESGVGNSSGKNSDWTMVKRNWSKRTLYVLVRDVLNPTTDKQGPVIVAQPQGVRIKTQLSASFFVSAPDAVSYQWYRDGVPVLGATGAELDLDEVGRSELGDYTVLVVGADGGRTVSSPARLGIGPGVMFRFR